MSSDLYYCDALGLWLIDGFVIQMKCHFESLAMFIITMAKTRTLFINHLLNVHRIALVVKTAFNEHCLELESRYTFGMCLMDW